MKIWLDDLRPAPWGYESARSVNEAKTLIREAERNGIEIEVLDLDHDLGDFASQGGDAIKLLDWRGTGERSTGKDINRVGADSSHSWITGLNGSSLDGCA